MSKKKIEEQTVKTEGISFEKALGRLETIVEEMEGGTLSLEDMMARFEEGQSLVKVCSLKLNQVERRIEILVKEGEKVSVEPFEERDETPEEKIGEPGNGLPF
jgi:exodeoxyribonuclease VII small subunit